MSFIDDLETVVRLAILTEHRDPAEQRALLRMAAHVEHSRNALVVTNKRSRQERACRLVDEVMATGRDDDTGRPLPRPSDRALGKLHRQRARWEGPNEVIRGDQSGPSAE